MIYALLAATIILAILSVFKTLMLVALGARVTQLRADLQDETERRERDVTWMQDRIDFCALKPIGRTK